MANAVGEIERVERGALAPGGGRYSFSLKSPGERDALNDSLKRQGQLTPLLVVEDDGALTVAAGSGRFAALTMLGAEYIWVRRFTGSRKSLWERLLDEQLSGGGLNPGEVALYLKKRLADTKETAEELSLGLLERLGLPARHGALDDPLWIGGLEPPELFRYAFGELPIKGVRLLMKAKKEDALAILRATRGVRLGANKLNEVIKCALECAWRDGIGVQELLEREKLGRFGEDGETLRMALLKLRYPTVSEWEESFGVDTESLKLPGGVNISHTPGFEGGKLRITFAFPSLKYLDDNLKIVRDKIAGGDFASMEKYLG